MIAFYSMGAGLGHLSRTLKTITALSLDNTSLIITNNQLLQKKQKFSSLHEAFSHVKLELLTPEINSLTFMDCLHAMLKAHHIKALYIDCFPVGIYGELNGLTSLLPNIKVNLIARIIKWGSYRHCIQHDNKFNNTFCVEPLTGDQLLYIKQNSNELHTLTLPLLPDPKNTSEVEPLKLVLATKKYCLIIHSGNTSEVCQLISYAQQKLHILNLKHSIVLACPWGMPAEYSKSNIHCIETYPITGFIEQADIVVSGAGFNLIHEMSLFSKPHWVIPFERKYDDQFARIARMRGGD